MQMLIEKGLFYMEQHNEDLGTNSDLALYRLQSAKSDMLVIMMIFI
jgi:hypothetical protein